MLNGTTYPRVVDAPAAPVVVALMGLPGSGKTTLAEALAPRVPARTVSRDTVRAAMFRPCSFTDAEKAAAFDALLRAVTVNCELGCSTIVDGMPFSRTGELEAVSQASAEHRCSTVPVLCSISIEEAQRRIHHQREASEPMAEDRDAGLVVEVALRFRSPPEGSVEVDATRPVEELAETVLGHIDEMRARGERRGRRRTSSGQVT
jgi:predicted kinase